MIDSTAYKVFIFTSEEFKNSKGRFDVRKVAIELAKWMVSNGCIVSQGPLRASNTDTYEYRVFVKYYRNNGMHDFNKILK